MSVVILSNYLIELKQSIKKPVHLNYYYVLVNFLPTKMMNSKPTFQETSKVNRKKSKNIYTIKIFCFPVSVPTYILGPNVPESAKYYDNLKDGEICTNLTYLGKRGLYTIANGIKIAYLSGVQSKEAEKNDWTFDKDDVVAVRNMCLVNKLGLGDYRGVDILLTSQWPAGIEVQCDNTSKLISWLAAEIKPRYHFCGLKDEYLQRDPFR